MANETIKEMPESLEKFNWGAFLWSWIWGLTYRKPITLLVILVAFIPFIGGFASLGLCIWFGMNGNAWAWAAKDWESTAQFNEIQKRWVKFWFIFMAASITIPVALTIMGVKLLD